MYVSVCVCVSVCVVCECVLRLTDAVVTQCMSLSEYM